MLDYENICKDILKLLGNNNTKVIKVADIKGSYYAYINNTIYLSQKSLDKEIEKSLVVLCHECIHSIQNKHLHKLNFIFSNIEILFSIILFIIIYLKSSFLLISIIVYLLTLFLSISTRIILEKDAVKRSFELSKECLNNNIFECNGSRIEKLKERASRVIIIMYLSLFWKKIVKIILMVLLFLVI